MGAKGMRTSRQQLIEEPATLADRTANGAGAQCERVPAMEEAARNAALYLATGFITCPRCGEEVETKDTDAEYTLRAALSSQEPSAHRETVLYDAARKTQKAIAAILASGGLESDKWWDDLVSAQQSLAAAIRSLSTPDHADAGKVEGDGEKWPMRELIAKAMAYQSVGDPHAKTVRGNQRWEWFVEDADKFINVFGYYLPALPAAPASEGAE